LVSAGCSALSDVVPQFGGAEQPAGTAPLPAGGERGLAAQLEEIAAAEVGRLAGLAAGMLGSGAALGVLEDAMRAALTTALCEPNGAT
jgi:hypothetical protein